MKSPLSLGIPVYNQAETIRETVESALRQTSPFAEVVVCENHSTDATAAVLAEFGDEIRVVVPPRHLSMAENWNYCVAQMASPWFSLLSGDDLVGENFCAAVSAAIASRPAAGFVRTDWHVIDEAGNRVRTHRQLSVRCRTSPPRTWEEQLGGPKACFAAFAARRDLWQKVGGYPTEYHLIQDWIFQLRLAPHAEFLRVPKPVSYYRELHRPELEARRVKLYIEDDWRYLTRELPALIGDKPDWIRRAAGMRLPALVRKVVDFNQGNCDEETKVWMREIASLAGLRPSLEAWLANPKSSFQGVPLSLGQKIKSFLRRGVLRW